MRFEKFLLDNYIETDEGQKIYNFFKDFKKLLTNNDKVETLKNIYDRIYLKKGYIEEEEIEKCIENVKKYTKQKQVAEVTDKKVIFDNIILQIIYEDKDNELNFIDDKRIEDYDKNDLIFRETLRKIPEISYYLFMTYPNFYFPYLFEGHFFKLSEICEEFDIILPEEIPGEQDYKGRVFYYYDLCTIFDKFRQDYKLDIIKFCVFLYGFSLKFCTDYLEKAKDIPIPSRVFYVCSHPRVSSSHRYLYYQTSSAVPSLALSPELL
ncbi:hypothetical protein FACS1894200_03000 [Spirochaetia bacterium]|nr:hypothetical protein FACS1894200_03000 [Spirochaetia bacterium]